MADDLVSMAVIANDIQYIKRDVEEIKHKMEGDYVTQDQFDPIKRIVYGLVSLVLTAVVVGLLALIIERKS